MQPIAVISPTISGTFLLNLLYFQMQIIVMGVSGSGKTSIGQILAARLSLPFFDADDFHSKENKDKMKNGIPLTCHVGRHIMLCRRWKQHCRTMGLMTKNFLRGSGHQAIYYMNVDTTAVQKRNNL